MLAISKYNKFLVLFHHVGLLSENIFLFIWSALIFIWYLFVNSLAPELTARVKPKNRIKVRDRVRAEVRVSVRVRVRVEVSVSISLNKYNSGAGELTGKYHLFSYFIT